MRIYYTYYYIILLFPWFAKKGKWSIFYNENILSPKQLAGSLAVTKIEKEVGRTKIANSWQLIVGSPVNGMSKYSMGS